MDCKTAKLVWNHPAGLIEGIRKYLPGVFESIEQNVANFVSKKPDSFDSAVKKTAGDGNYRVTHSLGDDPIAKGVHDVVGDHVARNFLETHFSKVHGQTIRLANICCNGCSISDGSLSENQMLAIQLTAVNTDPELL